MNSVSRSFLILLCCFSLVSCTGVKQEWGNFTAYYNTFFNAEAFFEKGLTAILKGQVALNTEKPIRVTEKPSKAGFTDFDKAIEKGAKILREYEQSKWVDDALFLIGKSYFYQMNYFSAEEKFRELYANANDNKLKQEAVFWLARTYYETKRYEDALAFINTELSALDVKWIAEKKAQIELVEAEIQVELLDFYKANELLTQALPRLKQKEYKAKGWFLKGQLLERLSRKEEALTAYSKVSEFTNEYTLIFLAKRKQAEIARSSNQLDKALKLFVEMSNDGKNYDIISDLNYEIGRTLQLKKETEKAEKVYKDLLYDKFKVPGKETAAKTYYGLAEIYKDTKQNLVIAAAYFDSAKTRGAGSLLLPDWFNASELAMYYGEYARLHKKNVRFDSLLYLSTLTPEQLDSVITKIQEQKKEELEALKKQQEKENSTLNVINTNPNANQNQQDETNQKQNGFLNHKNPNTVQQSKEQFMALWGNRPLVDNWRYASLVKNITVTDQNSPQSRKNSASKDNSKVQQLQALKIDLSEIPIDSAKRVTFLNDFAANLYQTGNVFFLNLNEPDSAKKYYTRIIKEFSGTKVYEQTQFTLSELLFANNDSVSAREMAYQLYVKNPQSSFSTVLVDRYGFESTSVSDSTFTDPVTDLLDIIYSNADTVSHIHKAESLKKLASITTNKELASGYLQQAAFFYIQKAVSDTSFQRKRHNYETSQLEWKQKEKEFAQFKDSIKAMMKDSTVQADSIKMLTYKKLSDSTLKQPDFSPLFPYLGQVWDSSRSILSVIKSNYASTTAGKNMELLRAEIELPLALKAKAEPKKQASDSLAQIVKTDSLGLSLPQDSLQLSSPKNDSSFRQPQTPKQDSNLPEREQGQ